MRLDIDEAQMEELRVLLEGALRDLHHEIAATDNARFRQGLQERRRALAEVARSIDLLRAVPVLATDTGEALERELARPGD